MPIHLYGLIAIKKRHWYLADTNAALSASIKIINNLHQLVLIAPVLSYNPAYRPNY